MGQKRMLNTFKEATERGFYDEYPLLPREVDPQLHMSRVDRIQPFYLICDADSMIALTAGEGRVEFNGTSVSWFNVGPGDFVYVPAGTPHRIHPLKESIVLRYKAQFPKLEGVTWVCDSCGAEVGRKVWDATAELPQEGYLRATSAFNADASARTCSGCGKVHAQVDVSGNTWADIAKELRGEGFMEATK